TTVEDGPMDLPTVTGKFETQEAVIEEKQPETITFAPVEQEEKTVNETVDNDLPATITQKLEEEVTQIKMIQKQVRLPEAIDSR
ncbi:unnamed protein product, partial [Rotaria magnacalcarata]